MKTVHADHALPRVHVEGPRWETRVRLVAPYIHSDIEGDPTHQEVRRALAAVRRYLPELRSL